MTFEFIADRPVLDFVPTLSERGTTNEEGLRTPADLAAWIAQSRLVHNDVEVTADQLDAARELREALFLLLAALINGNDPSAHDRLVVNTAAGRPPPTAHLDSRGELHRTGDLDAVLAVLANDCLDLFDSPDRHAMHWCDGDRCTRPYIDRSRGQRRRWCGMKGCGDRAKAATYRQRQRG